MCCISPLGSTSSVQADDVDYKVTLAIRAWERVALLIANGRENALDER